MSTKSRRPGHSGVSTKEVSDTVFDQRQSIRFPIAPTVEFCFVETIATFSPEQWEWLTVDSNSDNEIKVRAIKPESQYSWIYLKTRLMFIPLVSNRHGLFLWSLNLYLFTLESNFFLECLRFRHNLLKLNAHDNSQEVNYHALIEVCVYMRILVVFL